MSCESERKQTIGSSLRIPQLNIDLTYDLTAHNIETETLEELEYKALKKNNHVLFSPIFDDGTYLKIEGQHVLLMLEEMNVSYEKENFDIEVYEEVIEEKRITEVVNNQTVVTRKKQIDHFPLFFSPQDFETFMGGDGEEEFAVEENITLAEEGTVDAIFMLNNESELSVPVSFVESIAATPQQINEAMQSNSSFYLSKPMLSGPPRGGIAGFGTEMGKLSAYEADIYFTGLETGDPEDCE